MSAMPVQSAGEALANATYEALLWALARPGHIRRMPQAGDTPILETLIDRECRVYCETELLAQSARRVGAELVPLTEADHVFLGPLTNPATLFGLRQGSDLHPEDGATVILPATFGQGQRLRLVGPGVEGAQKVQVGGLPVELWPWRAQVMRYPMGFEIILYDGAHVLGLPRTTVVEVL